MASERLSEYGEPLITDHDFEPSPYCDCGPCSENCYHDYGKETACLKERHEHGK